MKTINTLIALSLVCLSVAACSKNEDSAAVIAKGGSAARHENRFLLENEMPHIDIRKGEDVEFILTLTNHRGEKKEIETPGGPGYDPSLGEKTYTHACGKKILLIVIAQELKTAASSGNFFYNTLIDPKTGEWITQFLGAETKDKDTGEVIADNQEAILAKLKAGITKHCPEILDPNNDKAVEQLLE